MQHSSPSNSPSSSSSSSSSDASPIENQKALGQELARVLLEELNPDSFPNPQASWREELYEVIEKANESKKTKKALSVKLVADSDKVLPERGGVIDFQTKSGKKLPKHVFAPMVAADAATPVELFCLSYGGFVPEGDTSIEHAYPHTKIRDNQVRLLKFLNDPNNEIIANAFLECEGINQYIRRDGDKVKASLLFFKHSYGAMTNLYLMSQGENSKKGAKDMLKWIEDEGNPMLGEPFLKMVADRGGSHAGILFDRVYQVQSGCREVSLNTNSSELIILPPSEAHAKGLGEVVRDWITKIGWAIKLHQVQHNQSRQPFKQHVEALLGHFSNSKIDENEMQDRIRREQIKLMRELTNLFSIQHLIQEQSEVRMQIVSEASHESSTGSSSMPIVSEASHQSSTGSSSELGACNKENLQNNFQETAQINSVTHRMRSVIKKIYPEFTSPVYQFIEKTLRKSSEARLLKPEHWESILNDFQKSICELSDSETEEPKAGKIEVGNSIKSTVTSEMIIQKIQFLFSTKTLSLGLELPFAKKLQQLEKEKITTEQEKEIKDVDEQMQTIETQAKACEQQIAEIMSAMNTMPNEIAAAAERGDMSTVIELSTKLQSLSTQLRALQTNLVGISETSRKRKREGDNSQSSTSDFTSSDSTSHASLKISDNSQSLFVTGSSSPLSVIPQMSSSSPPQNSEDGDLSIIEEDHGIFEKDPSSANEVQEPPVKKAKKEKEEDKDEVIPSVTPTPGMGGE